MAFGWPTVKRPQFLSTAPVSPGEDDQQCSHLLLLIVLDTDAPYGPLSPFALAMEWLATGSIESMVQLINLINRFLATPVGL